MSAESNPARTKVISKGLDWRAIWKAALRPFILWAAVVIVVSFVRRQPGVICATPVAWLLACWVGILCVALSRSVEKAARLTEAGLAGGIFGLLQGLLFAALAPFMGSIKPDERQKAVLLSVAMIVIGAIVSALVSMAVGARQDRRQMAR